MPLKDLFRFDFPIDACHYEENLVEDGEILPVFRNYSLSNFYRKFVSCVYTGDESSIGPFYKSTQDQVVAIARVNIFISTTISDLEAECTKYVQGMMKKVVLPNFV